jgi:hypothetical protein
MSSDFIKKQKKLYKNLKSCYCTVLQEEVYFSADGLNHILYYKRRPRKYSERYYRAGLIKYIKDVVEKAVQVVKEIKSKEPEVTTWSLEYKIVNEEKSQIIKVILIKKEKGSVHFLSVMRKNNKTKKSKTKKS